MLIARRFVMRRGVACADRKRSGGTPTTARKPSHRSQRATVVVSAAKDERVSRLEDFFESATIESPLLFEQQRESQTGTERDQPTTEPNNERAHRTVLEKTRWKQATENARVAIDVIKVRVGSVRLADPKDTALRTLASYEARLRERLHRFAPLASPLDQSVSINSLPVPEIVRGTSGPLDAVNAYRVPAVFASVALLIVARAAAMVKKRRVAAALEAEEQILREKRGEKQRARFQQMFSGEDGVDASVFSAVRAKGVNAVERGDDEDQEDVENEVDALESMEASMDDDIKKAYKEFVKNSRLGEGEFWNIDDEVEAFEKIEIDFDKE